VHNIGSSPFTPQNNALAINRTGDFVNPDTFFPGEKENTCPYLDSISGRHTLSNNFIYRPSTMYAYISYLLLNYRNSTLFL
jgi:hypothetical protein